MKCPLWLRQILTEDTANQIFCPVRVIAVSGALNYFVITWWSVLKTHSFDPNAFATGLATICGAAGVSIAVKKRFGD